MTILNIKSMLIDIEKQSNKLIVEFIVSNQCNKTFFFLDNLLDCLILSFHIIFQIV